MSSLVDAHPEARVDAQELLDAAPGAAQPVERHRLGDQVALAQLVPILAQRQRHPAGQPLQEFPGRTLAGGERRARLEVAIDARDGFLEAWLVDVAESEQHLLEAEQEPAEKIGRTALAVFLEDRRQAVEQSADLVCINRHGQGPITASSPRFHASCIVTSVCQLTISPASTCRPTTSPPCVSSRAGSACTSNATAVTPEMPMRAVRSAASARSVSVGVPGPGPP